MSRPTSAYFETINGRATPGFSSFMWLPFWPAGSRSVQTRKLSCAKEAGLGVTSAFSKPKGTGTGKRNEPLRGITECFQCRAAGRPATTLHPSSRRACSNVPRSKQLTTKSSDASARLLLASASVLPCAVMSSGGQWATYQPFSFFRTPKSWNSACSITRIPSS